MKLKQLKGIFFALLFLVVIFLIFKQDVLRAASRVYFDEEYYLRTYPEVAALKISPFEHYSKIGWKEGKNPNADMDGDFYIKVNRGGGRSTLGLNPLEHFTNCKLTSRDCYTNPRQLKKVEMLKNPKYYLAMVSLFRDEARFLKEWIEFHKMMGVEHFYLYNHLSKDNYMEVLKPYIEDGTVELENINIEPKDRDEWHYKIHFKVYNDIVKKTQDDVEWLIIIDSDEFLFPVKGQDLKSILREYDNYPSISVNWRLFGNSKITLEKNQLLTETMVMAENYGAALKECIIKGKCDYKAEDKHVKTIVKPRYVELIDNPHFAKLKPGYEQITENYEYFYGPFSPYQSRNILAINHYWARDWEFFKTSKLSRIHIVNAGLSEEERNEKIAQAMKCNEDIAEVYDGLIKRFIPALRIKVFGGGDK